MVTDSTFLDLFAVISLDGRIALNTSDSIHWSSQEDKLILNQAIQDYDVFLMGRVTYEVCQEMLATKRCVVISRQSTIPGMTGDGCTLFNPEKSDFKAFLAQFSAQKVALFGGASIYRWALERNLVRKIFLTLEPIIMGGGISLTGSEPPWQSLDGWLLKDCRKLNDRGTLQLTYVKEVSGD